MTNFPETMQVREMNFCEVGKITVAPPVLKVSRQSSDNRNHEPEQAMLKFRRATLLSLALVILSSRLAAQATPTPAKTEKEKEPDNIVVMEKFVAGQSNDPNGVLPPPNEMFGRSEERRVGTEKRTRRAGE